jgi:AraC-like DNA-binding protein
LNINGFGRASRPETLHRAWMIMTESLDEPRRFSDTVDRLLNSIEVHFHDCRVCSVPPGTHATFDPIDAITVHYVLAGEGSLQTGDEIHPFGPWYVVIVPARTPQSWAGGSNFGATVPGDARCSPVDDQWVGLQLSDELTPHIRVVRSEITVTNAGVPGFFDHLRGPILEDLAENLAARQIFELFVNETARPGVGSQAAAAGLMKAFLILMLRSHLHRLETSPSAFAMMRDPQLARAMVQILERPAEPHTVDTLASAAGMSRTTFLERFRKAFSQSPIEFLQEFRLKFAAHLLKTTNLPIKSVALAVGYSSRSYFSRAFRASYGADPTAYRVEAGMRSQTFANSQLPPDRAD